MSLTNNDDFSVVLTITCLKIAGYWRAATRIQQCIYNFLITSGASGCFNKKEVVIFLRYWHAFMNLSDCLYGLCNLITLSLALFKLFLMLWYRKEFYHLVNFLRKEFLNSTYDSYETVIVNRCRRISTFFVCCFTFFAQGTLLNYSLSPIIDNIGKNVTGRPLPAKVWTDWAGDTPYYEILYTAQIYSIYHGGLYYFSFDNFLCIITVHVAGQFRILQYRLAVLNSANSRKNNGKNSAKEHYITFKNCVQQHQILIEYCKKIEATFSIFALVQVVIFSLLICLVGYQIITADATIARRVIFICHIGGSMSQLFMFTYGCDCITRDSMNVATGVYAGPWTQLSMNKSGKMLRKDSILVILRSSVPCSITACGFSSISLETYTKVLSTAVSYFTLLSQSAETEMK
ncbi:odorant receptor 13a-like [Calliopsis andreniformis]|uniref:odorant receptor 13a-like n=1 Tax=Calliopsis andreniformis TaxID=337506 RepID=UPI003FCD0122